MQGDFIHSYKKLPAAWRQGVTLNKYQGLHAFRATTIAPSCRGQTPPTEEHDSTPRYAAYEIAKTVPSNNC